jgi:hypothetical protein
MNVPQGCLSVKFGIYMHQMTIFRGGYQIIVKLIFYHPIILFYFYIYILKPPYINYNPLFHIIKYLIL